VEISVYPRNEQPCSEYHPHKRTYIDQKSKNNIKVHSYLFPPLRELWLVLALEGVADDRLLPEP
jgi:hypothetical protein